MEADFRFLTKFPFGLLMAAQTTCSLAGIIAYYCAPFKYEGTGFVMFFLPFTLLSSLFHNLIHVMGYHRKIIMIRNRALMLPATLMVFVNTVISFVTASISTLILTINFIDSLRFAKSLIICYGLFLLSVAILVFACARLLILLFRAAPNGQIRQLSQIVIEGDKTARLTAASTTTTTTTSTTTTTNNFV